MSGTIVDSAPICVIIAARDASMTIAEAVRSALAEPEVAEVIVVDDGSRDATAGVARRAAAGDPRLRILSRVQNGGPARARNDAIAASTARYVAVLDGDDAILPGRFGALLRLGDWDLLADNILFLAERDGRLAVPAPVASTIAAEPLDLRAFVQGNLARGPRQRGELGFFKPLMRRDFLDRHGLRYAEDLRLGEDFDLYTRALLAGARFGVTRQLGYIARVRANSLSAQHGTADLLALMQACARHAAAAPEEPVLRQHLRQIRKRYLLRAFLDAKAEHGAAAALRVALSPPWNLPVIAQGVLSDKLAAWRPRAAADPAGRTLLPL